MTIPRNRRIHLKLDIARADGITWVNITDWVEILEVSLGSIEGLGAKTGADIGVRTLSVTLRNEKGKSFASRDKTSSWNIVNGVWNPLLRPYREVSVQIGIEEIGAGTIEWATPFEGYLGNDIIEEENTVRLGLRDKSKKLQDTYIVDVETIEGPFSPEELIQLVLDRYVKNPPTLYCPVPSGITFDEIEVGETSVWDVLQNVAGQIGWFIGYRWNGMQYALTFLEPPRNKNTYDYHFTASDDLYSESHNTSDADIRNALVLSYYDKDKGERVTLSYEDYPELRNEVSKDEFGDFYRVMAIGESDTSLIDTQQKALSFGEKCIWDVSELSSTNKVTLPLLPGLDLFDTMLITNPKTSSNDEFYAVQSVRHTLRFGENGSYRTEVIATGRVVGAKSKWLEMEVRPGRGPKDGNPGEPGEPGEDFVPPIPADPVWNNYALTDTLHLTWYKAEHASGYEIRDDLNWGSTSGMLYQGYAHECSFVPAEREMILYLRALNVAGEYSEGYATLDVSLPAPAAPDQPVIETYFNAIKIWPVSLNLPSVLGYYIYVTQDETTAKVPIMAGGDYTYPAPSGTTVTIQVSAYDVLGEGPKSEPLQATTTHLTDMDIPKDIIDESMLTKNLRSEIQLTGTTAVEAKDLAKVLQKSSALVAPKGSILARFERDFSTTDGEEPMVSHLAEIVPEAGRYAGAVLIGPGGNLTYGADVSDAYTVAVSRASAALNELAHLSLQDLAGARLLELAAYKHYAMRSDGAVFVDGEEVSGTVLKWFTIGSERVTLSSGLYDQLLVANTEVNAQTIASWALTKNPLLGYGELGNTHVRVADTEHGLQGAKDRLDSIDGEIDGVYVQLQETESSIRSDVANVEAGLISQIKQEAGSIRSEVADVEEGLISQIEQKADGVALAAVKDDVQELDGKVVGVETWRGEFTVSPDNVNATVSAVMDDETGLSAAWSEIDQTPRKISQAVTELDNTLSGRISSVDQKAGNINQYVGEFEAGVATKFTEIDQSIEGITQTVGDEESGLVSQVSQLADEITLKVQRRTSDGKLIVTGMGVAIDEEGQSEVAVLADRFRILGDVEGESQAVFAVDTQTQKIYIMGDLIAEGLMRATEVQAELIKTLLLQAELGIFDELRGLLMRADKLTVGGGSPGFISGKPENSHLWHFDNSLQSTQGLAPASGSATLAPDGGKFGGGVVMQSSLRYDSGVGNKNTVVVYRGTAKLSDYAGMTLAEM